MPLLAGVESTVTSTDTITIKMASGGGFAASLKPVE